MDENIPESGKTPRDDNAAGKKKQDGRRNNGKKSTKNRNGAPLCNGHTTKGKKCQNIAMPNGKCYKHGGASTGPSEEGRIALSEKNTKHGLQQRVYFKYLREDEKPPENRIPYDAKQIVEDEIFLLEVRQKRIMERIHALEIMDAEDPEIEITQEPKKSGEVPDVDPETGKMDWKPVYAMKDVQKIIRHQSKTNALATLEHALTQVTSLKGKMIALREKIETQNVNEDDGSLSLLTKILGDARKRFDIDKRPTVVDAEYTEVK